MTASFDAVAPRLFTLRGQRVVLDADLARIYRVPTKRFNEAIKRNRSRFPRDFAFRLTVREAMDLRSQSATSSAELLLDQHLTTEPVAGEDSRHGGVRYLPWAFTEHGALMAAQVLRSDRAVRMSVYVVRAFVRQREQLLANAAILRRLAEIDRTLLEHDGALRTIWEQLQPLLAPEPEEPRTRVGFHAEDRPA